MIEKADVQKETADTQPDLAPPASYEVALEPHWAALIDAATD